MSTSTWTGADGSVWNDPNNWNPLGVPDASSDVTIAKGEAIASASIGTVNSITDSSDLRFRSAGTNTVATFLDNSGELRVDRKAGAGGTILNIGGKLTNSGSLRVGNAKLSTPDTVTAAALDNTGGEIRLLGSSANQALLDVTGAAGFGTAGVLSGNVQLTGDSAIEFERGEITSLAPHAQLRLNGNDAFIEDSTALGKNSALTGLASIGSGALFALHDQAAVSTDGALVNDGFLDLDTINGEGGSSLTLAGALTNRGILSIGNFRLSASDKVMAASLDNTGQIQLVGSGANQALLDVSAAAGFGAAGVLSRYVDLDGDSAIEFKSGQITSLAASAELILNGNSAFIEDSTALGSNSALTGLASIGAGAFFELQNKAVVSTTGALANDGAVVLGSGSSLTLAGALTNRGDLEIYGLFSSASVTAKSFVNSGTVYLIGGGAHLAALNVSGATTNNGSISITTDTEELAGAVGGAGSFSLSNAHLRFDSSVSAGQTITETGANALILEQAQTFAATISGFGTGDTIDAANFLLSGTTFNFAENSGGAGGTLTLHDTTSSLTAHIHMTGAYTKSDFTLAPDNGTGTLVKFG